MKLIFAILLASLGTTASASIYHYKYHGQEMKLIQEPDYEFWKTEPFGPLPIAEKTSMAIQIDIWINTALMPGGVLGDFSFILDFAEPAPDYMWVTGNYGSVLSFQNIKEIMLGKPNNPDTGSDSIPVRRPPCRCLRVAGYFSVVWVGLHSGAACFCALSESDNE